MVMMIHSDIRMDNVQVNMLTMRVQETIAMTSMWITERRSIM